MYYWCKVKIGAKNLNPIKTKFIGEYGKRLWVKDLVICYYVVNVDKGCVDYVFYMNCSFIYGKMLKACLICFRYFDIKLAF